MPSIFAAIVCGRFVLVLLYGDVKRRAKRRSDVKSMLVPERLSVQPRQTCGLLLDAEETKSKKGLSFPS